MHLALRSCSAITAAAEFLLPVRFRHAPLPTSRPRRLFPRPAQRPIHSLLLQPLLPCPPQARQGCLYRRGRGLHPLRPDHRNLAPPLHGLQRPTSRIRLSSPPRQALHLRPHRLHRHLRRPRTLPLRQKRPRTIRRRPTPPRFLPRFPCRSLPTLHPIPRRPVDRASSHHPPALLHTSLKPLSIYPRRPRLLLLLHARRLLRRLLRCQRLPHRLASLARLRCQRRRLRRRHRRSHHHRRPARLRPLRPFPPPLVVFAKLEHFAPDRHDSLPALVPGIRFPPIRISA